MTKVARTRVQRFTLTYWTDTPDKRTAAERSIDRLRRAAKEKR